MIPFFRRIRRNVLSEGKTGKYIKYALGEIFLVVVGILIALQINTWNNNRINSYKEHEYLMGIKNDLENQIAALNGRLQIFDVIIDKGESIISDFTTKGNLTAIDSINTKLSYMMYALHYPEAQTTFNELSATAQINLIREKALRLKIISYYQLSEDTKSNVSSNVAAVFYDRIFPIIQSSVILHFEDFGFITEKVSKERLTEKLLPAFQAILDDPHKEFEIINAVSLRVLETNTNKGHLQIAKGSAEALLADIDSELSH